MKTPFQRWASFCATWLPRIRNECKRRGLDWRELFGNGPSLVLCWKMIEAHEISNAELWDSVRACIEEAS